MNKNQTLLLLDDIFEPPGQNELIVWKTLRARKTLTPRFTDFFADFEKKSRLFCSLISPGLVLSQVGISTISKRVASFTSYFKLTKAID